MSDAQPKVERITTENDWLEPYKIALAWRVGDLIFTSGQAAITEQGEIVGLGDFDAQVEQTMANVKRVLELSGSSMQDIVKVNIYVTDMTNFPKVLELREKYFSYPWPADTIVEVTSLAIPGLMIEVDATAVVSSARK
jgi:2-iminobutanoate/2-iminopropanoate deaminase